MEMTRRISPPALKRKTLSGITGEGQVPRLNRVKSMNQQGLLLITRGIGGLFECVRFLLGIVANRVGGVLLSVSFVLECVFACILLRRITGHCTEAEECSTEKDNKGFHLHSLVCLIRFDRFPHSIAMSVPPRVSGLWRRRLRPCLAERHAAPRIVHDPTAS